MKIRGRLDHRFEKTMPFYEMRYGFPSPLVRSLSFNKPSTTPGKKKKKNLLEYTNFHCDQQSLREFRLRLPQVLLLSAYLPGEADPIVI